MGPRILTKYVYSAVVGCNILERSNRASPDCIDQNLILLWVVSVYLFYHWLREDRPLRVTIWWLRSADWGKNMPKRWSVDTGWEHMVAAAEGEGEGQGEAGREEERQRQSPLSWLKERIMSKQSGVHVNFLLFLPSWWYFKSKVYFWLSKVLPKQQKQKQTLSFSFFLDCKCIQ